MDNFDLRKYLIENKATTNSRVLIAETLLSSGREYLKAAAKQYWDVDLDDPNAEQELEASGAVTDGISTLPVDAVMWMIDNDPQVESISEEELRDYLEEYALKLEPVAEYQFNQESYDFASLGGAGEYESTIVVSRAVNTEGRPVKIEKFDFVVGTDRGSMGGEYALMNTAHTRILKSISDIYDVDAGWYAGYKGRTKN
jgi:hypothetical protein